MRELDDFTVNQPDYSKYSDLKELKPGWMQFLQSMDCSKFAMTGIVVVAIAAFQKITESQITATITYAAITGIVALGVVSVTRRASNGETFTNPAKGPLEPGDVRGG